MSDGPLDRIRRELLAGGYGEDPVAALTALAPADLQSLMLEVYRRQAARVSPGQLLARYEESRFARPGAVGPDILAAFEAAAWALLPESYAALALSPLCPLGTSSVVASVDQNKVVSTVRNAEVVSDSTNVLALEAALRRRTLLRRDMTRFDTVGLAASQRQIRAQDFGSPRSWAHFSLLAVVVAGRDRGSFSFEAAALRQQVGYFISVLAATRADLRMDVAVTPMGRDPEQLTRDVLDPLSDEFPQATFRLDPDRPSGRGYYRDACYKVLAVDGGDTVTEVADGGCVDWTRKLLSDDKERLVIGGLGVDRLLM